jgi:hypothetical protein
MSKRFSLVDLALLLNAIQHEHVDHRWTDSYADRSLIEFTSAEVFAFLVYFLELDWRNQVLEYRRSIAKRFYDKRVIAWNTVSSLLVITAWLSISNLDASSGYLTLRANQFPTANYYHPPFSLHRSSVPMRIKNHKAKFRSSITNDGSFHA